MKFDTLLVGIENRFSFVCSRVVTKPCRQEVARVLWSDPSFPSPRLWGRELYGILTLRRGGGEGGAGNRLLRKLWGSCKAISTHRASLLRLDGGLEKPVLPPALLSESEEVMFLSFLHKM